MRTRWPLAVCLVALCLLSLTASEVAADGVEITMPGETLDVYVDTRWAGGALGGYQPIRIRIVNRDVPHELEFEFSSQRGGIPLVRRRLTVEPNTTTAITLSIPLVGGTNYGTLDVLENGETLEGLRVDMGIPGRGNSDLDRPSLVVISDVGVACDQFELAVSLTNERSLRSKSLRRQIRTSDHQVVPTTSLPESWIDYTGVDFVAVGLPTFESLTPQERRSLVQWMQNGGMLLIHSVGDEMLADAKLRDLTELGSATAFHQLPILDDIQRSLLFNEHRNKARLGQLTLQTQTGRATGRTPGTSFTSHVVRELDPALQWRGDPPFQMAKVMWGRLIVFRNDPFPGLSSDWHWLLRTLTPQHYQWSKRIGMSARQPSSEFLEFLIPGVRSVPLMAFLGLITLFTILIGPVNYFLLWRRKQLYLLVLTIPLIALVTSVSMFSYSMLAHGFDIKSRVRAVTILDQGNRQAATIARVAMHAGVAPADGLQFDRQTAVLPIWPMDSEFDMGVVDWTDNQGLQSGWLNSRTRTQLYVSQNQSMRGRLEFRGAGTNAVSLANGLEWNLRHLFVQTDEGLFYTETLAAGEEATLLPATNQQIIAFIRELQEFRPELPPGVSNAERSPLREMVPRPGRKVSVSRTGFAQSMLEQAFLEFASIDREARLPSNNCYAALITDDNVVAKGVDGTSEEASVHLLVGYY